MEQPLLQCLRGGAVQMALYEGTQPSLGHHRSFYHTVITALSGLGGKGSNYGVTQTLLQRVDHTYLKRGVYYFNRRVPFDVSRHYKSRRINFSLRTKSVRAARQSVTAITAQLEGYWQHLRLRDAPVPGAHLLRAANDEPADDGTLRFLRTCTCA